LCGPLGPPCPPAGLVGIGAYYVDNADLKPNGRGRIKQTNVVDVTVTANPYLCNPCACFGQVDDGSMDGTVWKVLTPSGPADYFTNRIAHAQFDGTPCPAPAVVTAIEIASWDFCGTGPSWSSVGLYPASPLLGPNAPDLTTPVALATTLNVPPGAADWSYPATTYDFPDVAASTSSTLANATALHVTVGWPTGDSCIWVASDRNGTGDDGSLAGACTKVPGSVTYFSTNGFTTPGTVNVQTLMMRVSWF
jgi:hypothetical protein